MRYIITISIILLLYSCSTPSKEEQAILDYEQTLGGTKTDLSMEIVSLEKLQEVTGSDSVVAFMRKKLGEHGDTVSIGNLARVRDNYQELFDISDSTIKILDSKIKAEESKPSENYRLTEGYYNSKVKVLGKMGEYEKVIKETQLIIDSTRILGEKKGVLASRYKCTYSIKNPFLNNVKQEITKTYVFSPSGEIIDTYK